MKRQPPPGIHVILGDAAGGTFTQAFDGGRRVLVDRDVLSVGPTLPRKDLSKWRAQRFEFWSGVVPADPLSYSSSTFDVTGNLARFRDAERINVWAAIGLNEQLFIASTLDLIESQDIDLSRVRLVQFENVLGMGMLNEERMAAYPEPVPLTGDLLQDYRDVWAALTSLDPSLMDTFAERRPNASPTLKRMLKLMARRFPDSATGLPHWDFAFLTEARKFAPSIPRTIGQIIGTRWEDGDLVGDHWLFGRVLKLADRSLSQPLLKLEGDLTSMRGTKVEITPFGVDVLEGKVSNYPTNPIDDWAAGVKLSSAEGRVWFSDGGKIVKP